MDKMRLALIVILGALTFTILLGNPVIVQAQEKCQPVYIRSRAGIEPETLSVDKGDCVVWINWSRGEEMQVTFREGKRCAEATTSSVRFNPDFKGCYLTDYVPFGETSSLVFAETGAYRYEVEFRKSGGGPPTKLFGTVIVK